MICKKCLKELTDDNIYPSDHRYCITCGTNRSTYLSERKQTLKSLREMNLESKIIQTKYLIKCAVMEFGLNKVIFHTLVGKTQLSFLILPKVCILIFYICLQIQQMNILKHLNTFVGNQKKMEQILLLYFPKIYMEKFGHLKKLLKHMAIPCFLSVYPTQ